MTMAKAERELLLLLAELVKDRARASFYTEPDRPRLEYEISELIDEVRKMSEFETEVWKRLISLDHLDIQTDTYGQLIIYTGLAETPDGELVEFNSDAPQGVYRTSG